MVILTRAPPHGNLVISIRVGRLERTGRTVLWQSGSGLAKQHSPPRATCAAAAHRRLDPETVASRHAREAGGLATAERERRGLEPEVYPRDSGAIAALQVAAAAG